VSDNPRRLPSRRSFLKSAGLTAVGSLAGLGALEWATRHPAAATRLLSSRLRVQHVGYTDGYISLPEGVEAIPPFFPDSNAPAPFNGYVFGIRDLTGMDEATMFAQKGHAQLSAPVLYCDEGKEFQIHLHNLGETQRPVGQPDNHTLHFHGFPNQIVYFDGVPDNSLAVPPGRELIYRYLPQDPGTYMYHCHVDDVEHVHMGLQGIVFVRPKLGPNYVYNDPASRFDRQFAIHLEEFDIHAHFNDNHNQDTDWSEYKAAFRLMNGRAWPDTIAPHIDPMSTTLAPELERLRFQPNSALVQAEEGEIVCIRISNLGFEEHSLVLPGIPLTRVGRDAKQQSAGRADYGATWDPTIGPGGVAIGYPTGARGDITTVSNRVDLGPGESRELLFTAPKYTGNGTDPQAYPFYNRNANYVKAEAGSKLDGIGGQQTLIHIYPKGGLVDPKRNPPNNVQLRPTGLFDPRTGEWTYASGTEDV
jgi:FtsP/CotA-like multicopper oxidase with cupredoxin domain